jgi:tRNA-2-methylthio-N6-dimethylallyladenosine synthase
LYVETVGCQMNVLDSEMLVASLRRHGYELVTDVHEADTILLNTCSVREHAEEKTYSTLGKLKRWKQAHPQNVIGVVGCMAQKDQQKIFERAPYVDLIIGPGQLQRVAELVESVRSGQGRQVAISLGRREGTREDIERSHETFDPLRDPEMRPTPSQAYLRIQIGCDKFCTYCVVPMTRGPEQCRAPAQILEEAAILAGQGCVEITLLGQTVNSYQYVSGGTTTRLPDLLARLQNVSGIRRWKFVTNYPRDMDRELLAAVRDLPGVAPYLHIPAQSGSDAVLRRMKRGYTAEQYREMMARIRELLPLAAISSDFIVGFCGETEADFQQTMALTRECRFKNSFIFKYSVRPGTKAAERLPDDVPADVKQRRNQELLALQDAISAEDNQQFIGQTVEVLVEGPSKRARRQAGDSSTIQLTGRTPCDRIVVFDGESRLTGHFLPVVIYDASSHTLFGQVADRSRESGVWSLTSRV